MDSEKEIWSSIEDFPDYGVSNLGRVRSYKVSCRRKPCILKGFVNSNKYHGVTLYEQDKSSNFYTHRLVLEIFVGPCPDGHEANHKDGIKANNKLENLEWITLSKNQAHAYFTGLRNNRGVMARNVKLGDKDVIEIRRLAESGIRQNIIAKMFKISSQNVNTIVHRLSWRHI